MWSNGATEASITVSPTATTTYNLTVTDGNGVTSTSVTGQYIHFNASSGAQKSGCEHKIDS
ncbi:MAG: hypothetical protein IPJ39_12220 [Saprospiraceae bacterium]|nr:hypothetical protein [Saprospiraceae bacterium]